MYRLFIWYNFQWSWVKLTMTTFADGISVIESVAEVEECDQKADVSTELLISKTSEISLLNDNEVRPKTWVSGYLIHVDHYEDV